MQPIHFYEPEDEPRAREEVRLKQLGVYVHEDGRRVAVGFDLTPFRERPSIEVTATNAVGEAAGSLTIIEALEPNFHLTMHLRDAAPTDTYEIEAVVYYGKSGEPRLEVDRKTAIIDVTQSGDQTKKPPY